MHTVIFKRLSHSNRQFHATYLYHIKSRPKDTEFHLPHFHRRPIICFYVFNQPTKSLVRCSPHTAFWKSTATLQDASTSSNNFIQCIFSSTFILNRLLKDSEKKYRPNITPSLVCFYTVLAQYLLIHLVCTINNLNLRTSSSLAASPKTQR